MRLKVIWSLTGLGRYDEGAGVFVGFCPALGVYSQGESKEEAKEALRSAINVFLSNCYDRGILERSLKDRGFAGTEASPGTPLAEFHEEFIAFEKQQYEEAFELDVPMHLIAAQQQAQCQP